MLSLLGAWLALAVSSVIIGAALAVVAGWPEWMRRQPDRFFTAALTGLLAGGSVALAAATLAPLVPWFLLLPLVLLVWPRVRREAATCLPGRGTLAVLAVIAPPLAYLESIWEPLYDAALYHTQLTNWIATAGLPDGLGLLHYRLGFSSSWLALGALFDHGFLVHRMGRCVTGFALLLIVTQFATALGRCLRPGSGREEEAEGARDWYLVGAVPVLLAISTREALSASPSPNLGAAVALMFAGWLAMGGASSLGWLAVCAAVAVKISVAPAALALAHRARPAVWLLGAALTAPLFWANYVTTGCPLFPAALCVDSPHSLGPDMAGQVAAETLNFARNGGSNPSSPYWDLSWVNGWLRDWNNQVVFVPLLLGILATLLTRSWNRAATLGLLTATYCLVTAPGPRFAFGAAAVLVGVAATGLRRYRLPRVVVSVCAVLLVLNCAVIVVRRAPILLSGSYWLTPSPAYLHGETGKLLPHHGLLIHMPPADDRCGALPLPCTPYPPAPDVRLCDPARGLASGFCRVTPTPDHRQ